ncbi:MAG: glycosyltransferase family 4 protein [Nostocaceae cyanobacterium]|nr:glycosyltransferase family 4 protein [Nostocaceae cyanobacterium]
MAGITVAYGSVHQIYQIALAAQEIGVLEQFFCSLIDAPGKWGNILSMVVGRDRLASMRRPELNPKLVTEYPLPFLLHYLMQSFRGSKAPVQGSNREAVNERFDRWVAQQLNSCNSRVFVGVETCAQYSFEVAQKKGMTTVLDCPQVHPDFLTQILHTAASDLGLAPPEPFDHPQTAERKRLEYSMADILLVLSEVQKRSFVAAGFASDKLVDVPLWADTTIFQPPTPPVAKDPKTLRVLFVGGLSIRKGIPYLLEAARLWGSGVQLTLLGTITSEIEPFLRKYEGYFTHISPTTKVGVRNYYCQSDVLVLPSLVDTFGWVAMEAMACGLPVIVSENCGVPVPDENWRVPIMNPQEIAEKIFMLRDNREYCASLGEIAKQFAQQFTPQRYRQQLQLLFKKLLQL